MVIVNFSEENMYPDYYPEIWQYNYGQILRIQGLNLPPAVEVDFSLEEKGVDAIPYVGITKDGVTEVPIPDSLLKNNDTTMDYCVYAYIFVSDETSGQTEYKITLHVKSRTKPGTPVDPGEPEQNPMSEIMEAINKIAAGKADKLAYEGNILKLLSGEQELSRVIIQGGGSGADAREIELRKSETAIQWHYVGEDTWNDLVLLSEITGKPGKDGATPEIGQDGNWYINGQDTGKPSRGEKGDKGEQGLPGKDGAPGAKGDPGENATDEQVQQAVDAYMQGVDFDTKLAGKLDKQQGVENAGKALVVGEDGNVVPQEVQGGGSQGKPETWSEIAEIVKSGKAQEVFKIGDQFVDKWTDKATGQEYDWTWDVVHFGNVTLENGETVPGMYLQAHYLTPFAIQFDHEENEKATEPTFSGDYSYYTKNPDGSFKLEEVVVGQQIPSETQYFHSAIKDPTGNICRYGYNRWSHSAYRQWLNSDSAEKGKWWTAQHLGDVAPNEHNSRAGFLSGFEQDFLSVIKKVKIRTQLNTITDKDVGTDEETVDLMFLPSKEQLYGTLEGSIYNDEAFEYYKQVAGFEAPNNGNSTGRIKYKLDAQTSADWQRLRSPIRWSSYNSWLCGATGNLSYYNAISAGRCAPACVIA